VGANGAHAREWQVIEIEVWSDVACPWCYLGSRRLTQAIKASDAEVNVTWKSFRLNPAATGRVLHDTLLMDKYGASAEQVHEMNQRLVNLGSEVGIDYRFDTYVAVNTLDAHRVLHLARERGLEAAAHERIFRAQFTDGAIMDDHDTLVALAVEVGLDEAEVREVLGSDRYASAVRAEQAEASALGASGVPFFVLDRKYGISGAQPAEVFAQALERARAEVEV
jgi:predicted DsbA family dithiol-disulfide isomerase